MRIGLLTTSKIGHFCSKSQICGKMDDSKKASVFKLRITGVPRLLLTAVIILYSMLISGGFELRILLYIFLPVRAHSSVG
jgi:hypothetical protein